MIVLAPSAPASPASPASATHHSETSGKPSANDAANAGFAQLLPERLRSEFENRDWFAIVQHDPFLAMAELALREKAQAARAAWGLQRMEGLALVIVEPTRWPDAIVRDLCAAVRRWLPAATLWSTTGDRIEPIASDAAKPLVNSKPSTAASARSSTLRVFDLDALVAALPREQESPNGGSEPAFALPTKSKPAPPAEAGRLTRDEIDMLLQHDAQDEPSPAHDQERRS